MSFLRAQNLEVQFHDRLAVDEVSFEINAGEFLAVLGANGSGKSTLLRACLGIIKPTAGEVSLFDTPQAQFRDWKRIGYVPQKFHFDSGVPATVREVVMSGRLAHRQLFRKASKADRAAVEEAIDLVDLTARSSDPIAQLSGGQHQRALIARALATKPDLLILDESTAGVDDNQLLKLRGVFSQLIDAGTAIVLITHELGIFEQLTKRALIIEQGRIIHDGEVMANQGRI